MNTIWIILLVMIGSGVLGGVMNFFIADPQAERPLKWWQHVVVGVAAALMVPLFLNMISSGLIDAIRGTNEQVPDLPKRFLPRNDLAGMRRPPVVPSQRIAIISRVIPSRLIQD